MSYGNNHKLLLQKIMHEGCLQDSDCEEFVVQLFDHIQVVNVIHMINIELKAVNMMIKHVNCEHTGQAYWVLTSTVLHDMSRFQLILSRDEVVFLKQIFSIILSSETNNISSIDCLNLSSQLDIKFSKSDAEEFLKQMIKDHWLYSKEGVYYMGVRSIAELMPYFRTMSDDFGTCNLCKEVIFHGHQCSHCDCVVHLHCLKNFMKVKKSPKCHNCNKGSFVE